VPAVPSERAVVLARRIPASVDEGRSTVRECLLDPGEFGALPVGRVAERMSTPALVLEAANAIAGIRDPAL